MFLLAAYSVAVSLSCSSSLNSGARNEALGNSHLIALRIIDLSRNFCSITNALSGDQYALLLLPELPLRCG